jgi:hypothetical protein
MRTHIAEMALLTKCNWAKVGTKIVLMYVRSYIYDALFRTFSRICRYRLPAAGWIG